MNYCEKCMQPLEGRTVCPQCGTLPPAQRHHLSPGTVLQEKFLIGRALLESGGSICYMARDISLDLPVLVLEYFPADAAQRDHTSSNVIAGLQQHENAINRFVEKARLLSEFRNEPCVAGVYGCFRQNQTAYMIMELPGGLSMQTYVWKKGPVPIDNLLELMKPMLRTLQQIHRKGLIHRNINPEDLRIYADGTMKLVGFGSVHGTVDENSLKPGYAPVELYGLHRSVGPWSDVYAICASIYTCITGTVPQLSVERAAQDQLRRPSEFGVAIPAWQEDVLMHGLAVWPRDRIQSVTELFNQLGLAAPEQISEPVLEVQPEFAQEQPVEAPAPVAPRWERVEDPANWKDLPSVSDAPAFLDPVSIQGKSYAEPVVSVERKPAAENAASRHFLEALEKVAKELDVPQAVSAEREEPAEDMDATVSVWKPFEPELPEEEAVTDESTVSIWSAAPEEKEEQAQAQPEEVKTEEAQPEEPKQEAPIPWEEPVPEWQGDYNPVEPIDPKFWQKELGITEPEEPFPWEETPGAWQDPVQQDEEQVVWPGIPEDEAPQLGPEEEEEKKNGKKRMIVLIAAALVALAGIAAVVAALFAERGTPQVDHALTMTIDGTAYELPQPVSDMNESGWTFSRLNGQTMIAGGNLLLIDLENNGTIKAQINNPSNDAAPLEECNVTGLLVSDPDVDLDINGIDLSTTPEELEEQLGKPSEKEGDSIIYIDAAGYEWVFRTTEEGTLKSIGVYTPKEQ